MYFLFKSALVVISPELSINFYSISKGLNVKHTFVTNRREKQSNRKSYTILSKADETEIDYCSTFHLMSKETTKQFETKLILDEITEPMSPLWNSVSLGCVWIITEWIVKQSVWDSNSGVLVFNYAVTHSVCTYRLAMF